MRFTYAWLTISHYPDGEDGWFLPVYVLVLRDPPRNDRQLYLQYSPSDFMDHSALGELADQISWWIGANPSPHTSLVAVITTKAWGSKDITRRRIWAISVGLTTHNRMGRSTPV